MKMINIIIGPGRQITANERSGIADGKDFVERLE
jgi:hypothetical protein